MHLLWFSACVATKSIETTFTQYCNNWLLCVDYNIGLRSDQHCDPGIEGQSQIYLKSICLMAPNTNSSFMF